MTTNSDDSPAEHLDPEIDPPPHLKRRVERSLRSRSLLAARPTDRMPAWFRIAGAAAAAVLLVAGGFWLGALAAGAGDDAGRLVTEPGRDGEPTAAETRSEARYVLLLYEGDDFRPSVDEDALVAEYRDWAVGLARRGAVVTGEKLGDAATLIEAPGGESVVIPDGDHGSALGRLGGYFVISAADRAEALAIARTCPHLRHGGRIVVQPIIPT